MLNTFLPPTPWIRRYTFNNQKGEIRVRRANQNNVEQKIGLESETIIFRPGSEGNEVFHNISNLEIENLKRAW